MAVSLVISVFIYWSVAIAFTLVEVWDKPKWFLKYKVRMEDAPLKITGQAVVRIISVVSLNQVIGLVISYYLFKLKYSTGFVQPRVPTLTRFLFEWVVFFLIRETMFYYSHRWLHSKLMYKHIHKRHHEWQSPISIATIYCHPFEHLLSNLLPIVAGPIVMHSHNLVSYLWVLYAYLLALSDHCGYDFPWILTPFFHNYHHMM